MSSIPSHLIGASTSDIFAAGWTWRVDGRDLIIDLGHNRLASTTRQSLAI